MDSSQMPTARGREIASTGCRHHPDASPQTERYRKRRCPTADSKAHAIDTAFGHGRPPVCFLSRQLESSRGGPGPPFHLDAILLSKCANNCTLPLNVELPNSLEKSGMSGVSTLTRSKNHDGISTATPSAQSQVSTSRTADDHWNRTYLLPPSNLGLFVFLLVQ